jgi:hypothetical protein
MSRIRSTNLIFKKVIVASCLLGNIFNLLKMKIEETGFEVISLIMAIRNPLLRGFERFP